MATLLEILNDPTAVWTKRPPATDAALGALAASCDFALPEEYSTLLRFSNGGEGSLCLEPWHFQLCSAEDVVAFNRGYSVNEHLPKYFAIGSSGGDDLLAISKADGSPCPVYMLPFIMAEDDVVRIADDFEMFAMALGRSGVAEPDAPPDRGGE